MIDYIGPCNKEIFEHGAIVFTTHTIPAQKIEEWVKKVALKSGQRVDWYYFGGRAAVLALGDLDKVKSSIDELMPEHDALLAEAWKCQIN